MSIERETSRSPASASGCGVDHDRVADPQQRERLVAVGGADVDVQAVELDGLLALIVLEQVHGLAPDDAGHGAVARLRSSTRWPTRICGSQPPIGVK